MALLMALLLLQGPGEGWNLVQAPPREVKRVYWDLFETTEVFVLLFPEGPQGEPQRVNLVFQAFFSGRAKRDPYTGLPQWPKGDPERLLMRVQPFPLTVVDELSLRLVVDDEAFDVGASCAGFHAGQRCQLLFPCSDGCYANGMSVEVEPELLQRLAEARVVTGTALGFPILLSADDVAAVGKFTEAIHLNAAPRSRERE
jgi:hypothetical protein